MTGGPSYWVQGSIHRAECDRTVIADLIRNPEGQECAVARHTGFKAVSTGRGMTGPGIATPAYLTLSSSNFGK